MNRHNTVEEHSRKVPTLQQSQNYSAWRSIWGNMKTVSFSKSKESGVKTSHWEVLILMLKADGYWRRERHSACVGVSSQLWHISYLPQLLLKVNLQETHRGSTWRTHEQGKNELWMEAKRGYPQEKSALETWRRWKGCSRSCDFTHAFKVHSCMYCNSAASRI